GHRERDQARSGLQRLDPEHATLEGNDDVVAEQLLHEATELAHTLRGYIPDLVGRQEGRAIGASPRDGDRVAIQDPSARAIPAEETIPGRRIGDGSAVGSAVERVRRLDPVSLCLP